MPLTWYGCGQQVCRPSLPVFYALKTWRVFWIGLICSGLVTGLFPGAGCPEARGRIQGVVQRGGQSFAEQRIMLIRFGPNQEVQRTPGQTDAAGRFLFENLETGSAFTYFVGVRYQEQLHRSEAIMLQSEEPADVVLEIGEQPAQEAEGRGEQLKPRIVNHLMVLVGRDTHLAVCEVLGIVNPVSTSYMDQQAHGGVAGVSLRFPLPPSYYNLGQVQGLAAEHVRVDASGLSYVAPLEPGEHQVVYTYNLPWHDELATILIEHTLGTSRLDVLVEDKRFVATSDLQFGGPLSIDPHVFAQIDLRCRGRVSIDPHVFAHFRAMNLVSHARSWLQLMPHRTSVALLSMAAYGLIIGMMLVGIILPLQNIWRGRVRPEKRPAGSLKHEQIQELRVVGRKLLWGIARLDDQHENGTIGSVVYQQRRHAYKAQLCSLAEQFQRVQESQDARDERRGDV